MEGQTVTVGVNMKGKNLLVAYILWWFLGWAGVHRFYLNHPKTGIAQLVLGILGIVTMMFGIGIVFLLIWLVWWIADAYFTYKMVEEENEKLGVENSTISVSKAGSMSEKDNLDQLDKLHSLYEKGVISKEQYDEKKSKLI